MLGVVVWSNQSENTAIVWCEDQGDLAFIEMHKHAAAAPEGFGRGDLIQFDIEVSRDLRLVQNPRRIAQHYCAGLDEVMTTATDIKAQDAGPPDAEHARQNTAGANGAQGSSEDTTNKVVDFASARRNRMRSVA